MSNFWGAVQKRYLSPVLDLFNGEIVCYTLYERPVLDMVIEMERELVRHKGIAEGAILHSDQGWQYRITEPTVKTWQQNSKLKEYLKSLA